MSSTAVQYAGALRHAGCTLSELRRTADCLTGCAKLWDALCSPAVSAREKKAVLARLPDFYARGALRHFYLLLADKSRFALLPEIVRQFRLLELRENGEGLCVFRSAREPEEQSLGALGPPAVRTARLPRGYVRDCDGRNAARRLYRRDRRRNIR